MPIYVSKIPDGITVFKRNNNVVRLVLWDEWGQCLPKQLTINGLICKSRRRMQIESNKPVDVFRYVFLNFIGVCSLNDHFQWLM